MRHIVLLALAAVAIAAPATAGRPTDTVGYCVSDGFYGNEPNMADGRAGGPSNQAPGTKGGNVLPSQSPGPKLNNPNDPDNPFDGPSLGDFHDLINQGGLVDACS